MIQRIQSLYLIGAALVMAVLIIIPFMSFFSPSGDFVYNYRGLFDVASGEIIHRSYAGLLLLVITILFPLIAIFMYKKRMLQLKLCSYTMIFLVLFLAEAIYFVIRFKNILDAQLGYEYGLVLPLISFILVFLARINIKKDDDLIKSVDRIR